MTDGPTGQINDIDLPLLLAGPILRRLERRRLCLWLALNQDCDLRLRLTLPDGSIDLPIQEEHCHRLTAGKHLVYHFIDLPLDRDLPIGAKVYWQMLFHGVDDDSRDWQILTDLVPDLCYPGDERPFFVYAPQCRNLLHGSCRKPHYDGPDGMMLADQYCRDHHENLKDWPTALVLSGDQIYADDVAGPMLVAIHQVIARLGMPTELLQNLDADLPRDGVALATETDHLYERERWLPKDLSQPDLWHFVFGGAVKPVFTSDHAHNHLFTLAEVLAMYLLVWSPTLWQGLDLSRPQDLHEQHQDKYEQERQILSAFSEGLAQVRRVMAHLPVAMIFDDHDVTDDWNLHRDWEETAYGHPLSRRILGNALVGYLINQGWGNQPSVFGHDIWVAVDGMLHHPGSRQHDNDLDLIFDFEDWHYDWPTEPGLVVLDTRTRRWRSEQKATRPSGLLDWEAVTDLQRGLRGREAVILVSAAPIFGVKLIESVQRFFTMIGKPLMVDAEYWMAHPGTANAILNIFRHRRTPRYFTILSGDVHYSFVYDVALRGAHKHRPEAVQTEIWQVSSSGLKNAFPVKLLTLFDRVNRWLFHPRSPLNWLTKRRRLTVTPRIPDGPGQKEQPARRLLSHSGIGLVQLDDKGRPTRIAQLGPNNQIWQFRRKDDETVED